MQDSTKLFAVCSIYLPIMLLALFSPQIQDFYTYSVPIKKGVIVQNFELAADELAKIQAQKDSTCFTTPQKNEYCYKKPDNHDGQHTDHLSSIIVGDNGINGEMHFQKVGLEGGIFTIKDREYINEDSALFTFADKDYRIGNKDRTVYEILEDFEFSTIVKKYDSFITHCGNFTGQAATVNQFLGVTTIYDTEYYLTWHAVIEFEQPIPCKYPQIIQHSLKINFAEL
ncbi:MAG: hypothetical protein ACE5RG_09350 [Candidatus Nitrosomaritimum yanchengensis]